MLSWHPRVPSLTHLYTSYGMGKITEPCGPLWLQKCVSVTLWEEKECEMSLGLLHSHAAKC